MAREEHRGFQQRLEGWHLNCTRAVEHGVVRLSVARQHARMRQRRPLPRAGGAHRVHHHRLADFHGEIELRFESLELHLLVREVIVIIQP